jgi:hypothetical protein
MGVSIKQGRVPSLIAGVFGIFWTIGVISMLIFNLSFFRGMEEFGFGAGMMAPFICIPVGMVFFGILISTIGFYNAFARNRMSSADIVTYEEEPDPGRHLVLNKDDRDKDPAVLEPPPIFPGKRSDRSEDKGGFCPYCGARVEEDYEFCRKCGRDI